MALANASTTSRSGGEDPAVVLQDTSHVATTTYYNDVKTTTHTSTTRSSVLASIPVEAFYSTTELAQVAQQRQKRNLKRQNRKRRLEQSGIWISFPRQRLLFDAIDQVQSLPEPSQQLSLLRSKDWVSGPDFALAVERTR